MPNAWIDNDTATLVFFQALVSTTVAMYVKWFFKRGRKCSPKTSIFLSEVWNTRAAARHYSVAAHSCQTAVSSSFCEYHV